MTKIKEIEEFYSECMNCDATKNECPMALKNRKTGYVPRGFHYESPNIKLLVVGKNPGHLLDGEGKLYINKIGKKLVEIHNNIHKEYYNGLIFRKQENPYKEKSNTFHKNLFRYTSFILDLPKDMVYSQMAHTNIFKCSTKHEQQKLKEGDILFCYSKFFLRELALFKPKAILALGREVESFLKKRQEEISDKLCYDFSNRIIYIKHPSYYYNKKSEEEELKKIKQKIKTALY